MSSPHGKHVDWTLDDAAVGYSAEHLPPGIALSDDGRFMGAATRRSTWTVTVTARGASGGGATSESFVWTVT